MHVVMRIGRVMQDAGRERRLDRDVVYDLPEVVCMALIATGAAKACDPHGVGAPERKPDRPEETPEDGPDERPAERPPDQQPVQPPETGHRRSRPRRTPRHDSAPVAG